MCKQHASAEWSGACSKEHMAQCDRYCGPLLEKHFEWFKMRHEKPAIIPKLASLKRQMGRIILDTMEVSIG